MSDEIRAPRTKKEEGWLAGAKEREGDGWILLGLGVWKWIRSGTLGTLPSCCDVTAIWTGDSDVY